MDTAIIIYTDGAARGNPGRGGWGSVVIYPKSGMAWVTELSGSDTMTTNNKMELMALLEAVRFLEHISFSTPAQSCTVYSDSHYVVAGMTTWIYGWQRNGWKSSTKEPVANQDLWQAIIAAAAKLPYKLQYIRVPGHAGVAGNERCDVLATSDADGRPAAQYDGPFDQYSIPVLPAPSAAPKSPSKSKTSDTKGSGAAWYVSLLDGVLQRHDTWASCRDRVHGKPAKYKKVTSKTEEDAFIANLKK
jgi:ribonuclease HI